MYQLRAYSPGLGRFISRDPIEEHGGLNLMGFLQNDGMNSIDGIGLAASIQWWQGVPPAQISMADISDRHEREYPGPRGLKSRDRERLFSGSDGKVTKAREEFFAKFKRRYKSLIDSAATAHCVPKRLLAGIIVNERADLGWVKEFAESNLVGLPDSFLERENYSLGVAQLNISTIKPLVPKNFKYADLFIPSVNIDLAAQVLRQHLTEVCKLAKGDGSFNASFAGVGGFHGRNITQNDRLGKQNYSVLCCAGCSNPSFLEFVPSSEIRMLFSGVWNMQPGSWMTDPSIDSTTYADGNAFNNGITASQSAVGDFLAAW